MYLVNTFIGEDARRVAAAVPPRGPGAPACEVERTAKVEVLGTSIDDPGPDYCEFVLYDAKGKVISRHQMAGY